MKKEKVEIINKTLVTPEQIIASNLWVQNHSDEKIFDVEIMDVSGRVIEESGWMTLTEAINEYIYIKENKQFEKEQSLYLCYAKYEDDADDYDLTVLFDDIIYTIEEWESEYGEIICSNSCDTLKEAYKIYNEDYYDAKYKRLLLEDGESSFVACLEMNF